MNCIDKKLKKINQDKTIDIIICKQNNKYVIKYCSDGKIISRKCELVWYNKYVIYKEDSEKIWEIGFF